MKIVAKVVAVLQCCILSWVMGIGVINNNAKFSIPAELAVIETKNNSQLSLVRTVYSEEGINTQSEDSVTITAVVKDSTGGDYINQTVSWSYAFKNAPSSYGAVSTYVKMTTNGTNATFTLLKPFNYQIIVTCKYTGDTSIKATATLDYCKRVSAVQLNFDDEIFNVTSSKISKTFDLSQTYGSTGWNAYVDFTAGLVRGAGSMSDRIISYSATIEPVPSYGMAINQATTGYSSNPAGFNKISYTSGTFRELLEYMYWDTVSLPIQANLPPILDIMRIMDGEFVVTVSVKTQSLGSMTFQYTLDLTPNFVS